MGANFRIAKGKVNQRPIMVILIDAERRSDWLVKAIDRRLREEFAKLRVEINEDKSRVRRWP
jgi:hypothetical protein